MKRFITLAIIPTIMGIILLNIEYSYFIPKENLEKKVEQLVNNLEKPVEKSSREKFVEKDDVLETIYKAASYINDYTKRNEEYARIINLALEKDKPWFAINIASEINDYNVRNEQYIKIIDYTLSTHRISLALEIAKKINVYEIRNEQYKKIIDYGFKQSKKQATLKN